MKRILQITSEIQAQGIRMVLDENSIEYLIRSFHDSAYDGLFQHQYGWGVLEADESEEQRIFDLLRESQVI